MELIKNIIEKLRRWRFNRWVNAGNRAGWVHRTANNNLVRNNGDGVIYCKFPIKNPSEQLPPRPPHKQMNPPMKQQTNTRIKKRPPVARPPARPRPPEKLQLKTDNDDNKKQKETKDNE